MRTNSAHRAPILCSVLIFFATAVAATTATPVAPPPPPCVTEAHKQFDFWIGDWVVHGANGKLAGSNKIEKKHRQCVLHEQYKTPTGYTGESFNMYDAGRKIWHQTWVDNGGTLLLLEGGMQNGSMVLSGETTDSKGAVTKHKITWTPNSDASVRQLWESTDPTGKWITAFDGKYTRKVGE
jgi:hypothetical protein